MSKIHKIGSNARLSHGVVAMPPPNIKSNCGLTGLLDGISVCVFSHAVAGRTFRHDGLCASHRSFVFALINR